MQKIDTITVIAGDYPAPNRNRLVFVQELVHAMLEQGVKINVIAPQSIIHAIVHKEKILPRKNKCITNTGKEYDLYRPYSITFGNYNYVKKFTSWFNRRTVEKILHKVNSDVLYCHFWDYTSYVYQYAKKKKKPLFVACGESEIKKPSSVFLNNISSIITGVISVSTKNKLKCIEYNYAKEEKIEVFPNCVDTKTFYKSDDISNIKKELNINDNDFVISFVGNFISRKGPDRVAEAIRKIGDPHIKIMFIGKPYPGYNYDFDCPGIIHKGPINHNMLPKYLNCSDIFVLPTQDEGCCNAIVEALAIGLPIISSDGSFNDDILDKNNSIRINPNDIDAIACAIKKLKDDTELRKKISEYSLTRHEEYSVEGRAKRILDFIQRKISE